MDRLTDSSPPTAPGSRWYRITVVDNAPGRHFYACHLTFEDQPGVQRLVRGYQAALAGLDGLDLIPGRYLLVLDMDLLALGEEFDLEPVNYLATRAD